MGDESESLGRLRKKVKFMDLRTRQTQASLNAHMVECARMQKWVLRVGAVTLAWVMVHSPEAAKAAAEVAKVLFP